MPVGNLLHGVNVKHYIVVARFIAMQQAVSVVSDGYSVSFVFE